MLMGGPRPRESLQAESEICTLQQRLPDLPQQLLVETILATELHQRLDGAPAIGLERKVPQLLLRLPQGGLARARWSGPRRRAGSGSRAGRPIAWPPSAPGERQCAEAPARRGPETIDFLPEAWRRSPVQPWRPVQRRKPPRRTPWQEWCVATMATPITCECIGWNNSPS